MLIPPEAFIILPIVGVVLWRLLVRVSRGIRPKNFEGPVRSFTLRTQSGNDTWIWLTVFVLTVFASLVATSYCIALILKLLNLSRLFREDDRSFFEVSWWIFGVALFLLAYKTLGVFALSVLRAYKHTTFKLLDELGAVAVKGRGGDDPRVRRLVNICEEIAIASGRPAPSVYVLEDEDGINAFTAGLEEWDTAICVTAGALKYLRRDELQAVIAHEFGHVVAGDVLRNTVLLNTLAAMRLRPSWIDRWQWHAAILGMLACVIGGGLLFGDMPERTQAPARLLLVPMMLALVPLLPIYVLRQVRNVGVGAARLAQAAFSRRRELEADALAVQLTRHPEALANVLRKIAGLPTGTELHSEHAAVVSHMCIAPALSGWSGGPFAAHPSIARRVAPLGYPLTHEERRQLRETDAEALARYAVEVDEELGLMHLDATNAGASTAHEPVAAARPVRARSTRGQSRLFTFDDALGGEPDIHRAARLLAEIPDTLREALRTDSGARGAARALLAGADIAALPRSDAAALPDTDAAVLPDTDATELPDTGPDAPHGANELEHAFLAWLQQAGEAYRLPVIELAMPALNAMSAEHKTACITELRDLISNRDTTTLRGQASFLLLTAPLRQTSAGPSRQSETDAFAIVLGAAAYEFAESERSARSAFVIALAETRYKTSLPPRVAIDAEALEAALDRLRHAAPLVKPAITRAIAAVACYDGRVTAPELEFLRAVGAAIDCPIPPLTVSTAA